MSDTIKSFARETLDEIRTKLTDYVTYDEYCNYADYAALSAQLEAANARADALHQAQSYQYIGKDGKSVLARELEDKLEAANARADRARDDALVEAWDCIGHTTQSEDRDAIHALRYQPTPSVELGDVLSDPNAVHINMLHGRIATPSVEQIVHIYAGKVQAVSVEPATVQEAARVLLDTMTSDRATFDAMVEAAEDADLAGASFNKVVGNALRAALVQSQEKSHD